MRRLSRNEAKLSLEGAEGNREEKKFEAAGSPKLIGEGESVAGCDISVNDLCGRVITLASFKKIETVVGLPCGAVALVTKHPSHSCVEFVVSEWC